MSERICPVCRTFPDRWLPGPGGRPEARCPNCQSLERHRTLALLMDQMGPYPTVGGVALEVAPSQLFDQRLRATGSHYVGVDFDPGADGRDVTVAASLTDMPLADSCVDLGLAYHVLEHIPDDASAMQEIARVLNPCGVMLVQVPWRPNSVTDEDPTVVTDEERTRRFGQADHVRFYGADVEDRFTANGLKFKRLAIVDYLDPEAIQVFRLVAEEPIWVCCTTNEVVDEYVARLDGWGSDAVIDLTSEITTPPEPSTPKRRPLRAYLRPRSYLNVISRARRDSAGPSAGAS